MYNSKLEKEISELGKHSMPYLKDLWESYFDESAPLFNKATLVNKLAYRMQELASMFCQPVYEAVITEAVARGHLSCSAFLRCKLIPKPKSKRCKKKKPVRSNEPKPKNGC